MLTPNTEKLPPQAQEELSEWLKRARAAGQRVEIAKACGWPTSELREELLLMTDAEHFMQLLQRLDLAERALAELRTRASDREAILNTAQAAWASPPPGLTPFTASAFASVHHVLREHTPPELLEEWAAAGTQGPPEQLLLPVHGSTCTGCGAYLRNSPATCPLCGQEQGAASP